jgi:dihydroneopterin aldolase
MELAISGLEVFAHHGILDEEKELGQVFRFDLRLTLSDCPAQESDDMAGTVDYAAVADQVAETATAASYDLLERLASVTADVLLEHFPRVESLELTIAKPAAPMLHPVDDVSVTLRRRRPSHQGL